jgi:hypothetical protein
VRNCVARLRGNVRSCRDEVRRVALCRAGRAASMMRTSEPRDRPQWTPAASVHRADIDYSAWSRRHGDPRTYPPLCASPARSAFVSCRIQIRPFCSEHWSCKVKVLQTAHEHALTCTAALSATCFGTYSAQPRGHSTTDVPMPVAHEVAVRTSTPVP